MRWVIGLTFAGFIGILVAAYLWSRSADPQLIDVDPVAVDAQRHRAP